jgi:hypothetical protein
VASARGESGNDRRHISPGAARTWSDGVRCSDRRPRAWQRSASDRGCRNAHAPAPQLANQGAASGDRVVDWRVPLVSPFSILKNSQKYISAQEK